MLPDRFLDKISPEPNTGCWLWSAATNNQGYGVLTHVTDKKRVVLAHRFAYQAERGPIPEGLELDHECHTPLCVNPYHVEPKTHTGNMKNSLPALKQYCANGHLRTPENTYVRKDKPGRKQCKVCNVETSRRRYIPTGRPQNAVKTHCKRGHEFTPDNIYIARPGTPRQSRQCKTCTLGHPIGKGDPTWST
jgi:hypothetical protein